MKYYYLLLSFLLFGAAGSVASAQDGATQTSAPIIHQRYSPELYEMSEFRNFFDFCAIEFENTDNDTVTVYYRYHYCNDWDHVETSSDWKMSYPMAPGNIAHVDRDLVLLESAWGWVEVYSMAKNKSASEVQRSDFFVDLYPSSHFQRDYDFAVGDMYYRFLSDSTVVVAKRTVDKTAVFDPVTGYVTIDQEWSEWAAEEYWPYKSANPCYWGDVVIPSTVEYKGKIYTVTGIHDYAFECCELSSVQLPSTLTSIGDCAFYEAQISDITIPASVSTMGIGAFSNCYSLTNVNLSESLDSIPAGAFAHCSELTNVAIPESVTSIGAGAFLMCENVTSVEIPESVTSIGAYAFSDVNLTSIEIPNSVEYIGGGAFACPNLSAVICRAVAPPSAPSAFSQAGDGLPWDIYRDAKLYVPNESLEAYMGHEDWSWFCNFVPFIGAGPGDINGDGSVAIGDVSSVIDMLLDGGELPAYCDVNGDGEVTIADVSALIDMLLGV